MSTSLDLWRQWLKSSNQKEYLTLTKLYELAKKPSGFKKGDMVRPKRNAEDNARFIQDKYLLTEDEWCYDGVYYILITDVVYYSSRFELVKKAEPTFKFKVGDRVVQNKEKFRYFPRYQHNEIGVVTKVRASGFYTTVVGRWNNMEYLYDWHELYVEPPFTPKFRKGDMLECKWDNSYSDLRIASQDSVIQNGVERIIAERNNVGVWFDVNRCKKLVYAEDINVNK